MLPAKQFFAICRRILGDARQHRRLIIVPGPIHTSTASQNLHTHTHRRIHLALQFRNPVGVESGPTSVAASMGSPTRSAFIFATKPDSNFAAISSATINRFAAMQDWPLLTILAATAVLTALSKISARHNDERVAPTEFQNTFLICRAADTPT